MKRPTITRPDLIQHPVLRHLEQPRRELAPERERRQCLKDTQKDLLRNVLRQGSISEQPEHVVEDACLLRSNEDGERSLVTTLRPAHDLAIRLAPPLARRPLPDDRAVWRSVGGLSMFRRWPRHLHPSGIIRASAGANGTSFVRRERTSGNDAGSP